MKLTKDRIEEIYNKELVDASQPIKTEELKEICQLALSTFSRGEDSDYAYVQCDGDVHDPMYESLDRAHLAGHNSRNAEIQALKDELRDAREMAKFYADEKDWGHLISTGGIFDEQDGDLMMAFNKGEDCPWDNAKAYLSKYQEKEG